MSGPLGVRRSLESTAFVTSHHPSSDPTAVAGPVSLGGGTAAGGAVSTVVDATSRSRGGDVDAVGASPSFATSSAASGDGAATAASEGTGDGATRAVVASG